MKKITSLLALVATFSTFADTIPVHNFRHAGPFNIPKPAIIDSLDVNSKRFSDETILNTYINIPKALDKKSTISKNDIGTVPEGSLNVISFSIENRVFTKPEIIINGIQKFKLALDGKEITPGGQSMTPGTHDITIKYIADSTGKYPEVAVVAPNGAITLNPDKRLFTLDNVLHGTRIHSAEISPDGKFIITVYYTTLPGGSTNWKWTVTTSQGKHIATTNNAISWMPAQAATYYYTTQSDRGRNILTTNALTGETAVFAENIPDGNFTITPDEKSLIISKSDQGPKEDPEIYRILEPEDRQPGWRNRVSLLHYDLATGITRPLTHSHHNVNLLDISDDSKFVLVSIPHTRLSERPTTLFTIATIDIQSAKLDTIVVDDGFVANAIFAPNKDRIIIAGSPEALGGIGKNLPEGRTPSMVDNQLFMYNTNTKKFTPLTRDFNPSVGTFAYSKVDGLLYFTAENRDCIDLFTLNLDNGKFTLVPTHQDIVKNFSLPLHGTTAVFTAQAMDNPDRLYTLETKKLTTNLLDEPLAASMKETYLAEVAPWNFINSRGDTIYGRFYLPPTFDPGKKYPLIVNYYGGCSPTSRNFESRYPHHAYAAQDYVVYVIEPGGATGFGQEFSSRHVNTAGSGVAEDIIEGTKEFCRTHQYVDSTKIGCIGASYGGFMTQYLQTVTDIFAAAISHAGISDHTSYWGEGYWGYSYSEVSMANSYPWSDQDLYVKQSPLYNAHKIHTPILFLHGDSDNNVPIGESIQMYTALKLLGCPTEFVAVADQDHHIMDYEKRIKWQNTIFAWFAKYLKNDPTWWDSLYPPLSL